MVRTVSRKVNDKRGRSEMMKFVFDGLTSSAASRAADMTKYNIESKRGLHQGKPYKRGDFELLGEFEAL